MPNFMKIKKFNLFINIQQQSSILPVAQNAYHRVIYVRAQPVSGKILSLEIDFSSLINLPSIVFSMLKITSGLKIL